jgi:hypothetical protein
MVWLHPPSGRPWQIFSAAWLTSDALLDPKHPAERKVRQAVEAARRLRRDDSDDLGRLAAPYRTVVIESLAQMLTAPGRLIW